MKEPSTYAGLAGVFILIGVSMDDFNIYVTAITGILSFIAIVMKETKGEETNVGSERA